MAKPAAQAIRQNLQTNGKPLSLKTAEWLYRSIGNVKFLNRDIRKFNLSLEDWAARFLTVFSIYIPQGFLAVKENRHKWETNGRNVVIWTMTFALTALMKNDKFSANSWLNRFMAPNNHYDKIGFGIEVAEAHKSQLQKSLSEKPAGVLGRWRHKRQAARLVSVEKTLQALGGEFETLKAVAEKAGLRLPAADASAPLGERLNHLYKAADQAKLILKDLPGNKPAPLARFRLDGNYFQLLRKSGLRVDGQNHALWSSMDINDCDKLVQYLESKLAKSQANGQTLNAVEQKLLKLAKQVVRRSSAFRLVATSLITAATVYVIGGVAMEIVYRFIAPFDHDFVPPDKGKNRSHPVLPPRPPRIIPPVPATVHSVPPASMTLVPPANAYPSAQQYPPVGAGAANNIAFQAFHQARRQSGGPLS